jgi:molybdate transport system substrate-binding protein
MRIRALAAAAFAAAVLATAACGAGPAAPPAATGAPPGPAGPVTVLAAASLTESFTTIGKRFEAANPGTSVTFSFAGSSQLARQIAAGAPADVFAAASPATMRTVMDAGDNAGEPVVFVRNQLVIAVPRGNPARVASLADLARPGLKLALCAEQVPCGAAARTVLAGRAVTPVTLEQDVKAALAKVRLGEVDAALVYRTDVRAAAGDVEGVEFPESAGAVNDYPIVALRHAPNAAGAAAFVAYVRGPAAAEVLTAAGFQPPR